MSVDLNTCGFCEHYMPHNEEYRENEFAELVIGHCDHPKGRALSLSELMRLESQTACLDYGLRYIR